jgi:F-type H+-transporting ATPase subunit b
MLYEAEFWVAVAFVIFVGVLIYFRVHKLVVNALDERATRIRAHLDEARRLKEEAQALLAEYQRKQREAEREAAEIVAGAKAEEFLARRTKMAETKIAQAEAQAVADVRAAAAEAAVAAAETILTQSVKGKVADDLIKKGIEDLKSKLN